MAKDNKVRMPTSQGGLTRYFDEFTSRFELSPGAVIVIAVVIMIVVILLNIIKPLG